MASTSAGSSPPASLAAAPGRLARRGQFVAADQRFEEPFGLADIASTASSSRAGRARAAARLQGRAGDRRDVLRRRDQDFAGDAIYAVFAGLERKADGAAHLLDRALGEAYAARLRRRLDARGLLDAVAVDPLAVGDQLPVGDAESELDPILPGHGGVPFAHAALDLDRALHRLGEVVELGEQVLLGLAGQMTVELGDARRDERPLVGVDSGQRLDMIVIHQARQANDGRRLDGCRPAYRTLRHRVPPEPGPESLVEPQITNSTARRARGRLGELPTTLRCCSPVLRLL